MPVNVEQLVKAATKDQVLELLIAELQALGFQARSWHVGGVRRTMLEVFAKLYASATGVVRDIARGGYNDTAEGDWLTLFSLSHYANARKSAQATEGRVRLVAAANAPGPYVAAPGDLVFVDALTAQSYRSVDEVTIAAGEVVDVLVRAEQPGAAGDVAPSTITVMRTPMAGVTASNPIPSGQTSWITRNGADEESDASLRERNRLKWATRSASTLPGLGYAYYGLSAHPSVRRAAVDDHNPRGPGTIDLYIAGDAGPVSSTVAGAVDDYLRGHIDGVPRIGLKADLLVKSAERRVVTVRGTAYIAAEYNTAATQRAIVDALKRYFRDVPIGGTRVTVGGQGHIPFGELYRAVLTVPGVRNVAFTEPSDDLELRPQQVAVALPALRYVSV